MRELGRWVLFPLAVIGSLLLLGLIVGVAKIVLAGEAEWVIRTSVALAQALALPHVVEHFAPRAKAQFVLIFGLLAMLAWGAVLLIETARGMGFLGLLTALPPPPNAHWEQQDTAELLQAIVWLVATPIESAKVRSRIRNVTPPRGVPA